MAERPPGDRRVARRHPLCAHRPRARGGGRRGPRRDAWRVHHLSGDRGGPAPQRRPAAALSRRDLARRAGGAERGGSGRLRRAERAHGARRRVRAPWSSHSGHGRRPQTRGDPRGRIQRHALLRARTDDLGGSRRDHRSARRRAAWRALHRLRRPRRSDHRDRHHPEPTRRARRRRDRAGSGGPRARPGDHARDGSGRRRVREPGEGDAGAGGGGRGLSAVRRAHDPRGPQRPVARMAPEAAEGDRAPADLRPCGRDQLPRL